jgi:hypothetical protein
VPAGAAEGLSTSAEAVPGADPSPVTPTGEVFEFAGEKFPTREAAEAHFKRVAGTYRSAQSSTAKLEARIREFEKRFEQADTTSRGWYEYAQRLEQATSKQKEEAEKAAKAGQPQLPFGLSKEDFRFAGNLATEHGFEYGAYVLFQKAEERVQKLIDERVQQAAGPLAANDHKRQLLDKTMGLWTDATQAQAEDGSYLFPELVHGDEATANEILRIWMGLDPRFAFSHGEDGRPATPNPEAIAHAVWRYRTMRGGWSGPAGGGAQPARQGASVAAAVERAGAAASQVLEGTGQPRPAVQPTTAAGAIKESLKRAAADMTMSTPDGRSLGFSRAGG